MALTDPELKAAQPREKPYPLTDSGSLYLEVMPNGAKYWRWRYRYAGKQKRLAMGVYPEIGLKAARAKRDEAKRLLADGVDPGAVRKLEKVSRLEATSNSFEAVALEWLAKFSPSWSASHMTRQEQMLRRDLLPWLGTRPIAEITPPEILATLRRLEDKGALESARRARVICGQIFRYAVATGRAERDQAADLRGAIPPAEVKHLASITEPKQIGPLLLAMDRYHGHLITRCALRLAPLLFVRPGELRQARWDEIDLERGEWRRFVTKTKTEHIVPLSRQAVEVLNELQPLTGRGSLVFPGARNRERPMSERTMNQALETVGYGPDQITPHGFRAMARTVLDEVLGFRVDWIEAQLAHAVKDANGRAYNRTAYLEDRRRMMQVWADYLDELREVARGGNVVAANFKRQ